MVYLRYFAVKRVPIETARTVPIVSTEILLVVDHTYITHKVWTFNLVPLIVATNARIDYETLRTRSLSLRQ